ncbi:MAG TPA: lamin tail domain-containing protein [Candidatus Moranbacteria bacterium]|nr:lamin tail domain-containing protein [Candidatus Moranbacteria bacterium]
MGIKKLLKYQTILLLSILLLFIWPVVGWATDGNLLITEIMYDPDGSDTRREWIEIYNQTDQPVDLSGWKFFESDTNHGLTLMQGSFVLPAYGYVVIAENATKFLEEYAGFSGNLLDSSFSLSNEGEELAIKNKTGEIVAQASYSKDSGGNDNGFSLELDEDGFWRQSYVLLGTPGEENSVENKEDTEDVEDGEDTEDTENDEEPMPEEEKICENIELAEIFPFKEEYVKVLNKENVDCNLKGWSIVDGMGYDPDDEKLKNKKWNYHRNEFAADEIIEAGGEAYFRGNLFLNDTDDVVKLFNAQKLKIQDVSYEKAQSHKKFAYVFNGKKWAWDSEPENDSKNDLKIKIDVDKNIFVNVFADFEILKTKKKAKITWNFGDGHRSYLKKTRHKYEKTGKYAASVKYRVGKESATKNFTVEVIDFPHPKVSIVSINANPEGKDSENETITIQNKSKKKINLFGWSIATGWKKLINHPVLDNFEIQSGKSRELTREFSRFTLNNKKAEIELRYPDGKTAYKMKYKKEDGIKEGEVYEKEKGGWNWTPVKSPTRRGPVSQEFNWVNNKQEPANNDQDSVNNKQSNTGEEEMVKEDVEIVIKKKEVPALLAVNNKYLAKMEFSSVEPRVLGAETIREVDGIYHFTPQYPKQEHYAVTFLKNIFTIINTRINLMFNFFLN